MPREPKTRYPFPDRPDWAPFPESPPWDTPISELSLWSISIKCETDGVVLYPLRLMAANIGWKKTLRTIVPKLTCRKCGGKPARVALLESDNGDGHTTVRGREHVLVEHAG